MTYPPTEDSAVPRPPQGLSDWIAHTPSKTRPGEWHLLTKHAHEVARLARDFAHAALGEEAAPWAEYLGLLHDLGKFRNKFQEYLFACWECEQKGQKAPKAGSVPHKHDGALVAMLTLGDFGQFLATTLYGHHGGMPSLSDTQRKTKEKTDEKSVATLRAKAGKVDPSLNPTPPAIEPLLAKPYAQSIAGRELFLRILYSCLTDADGLDTEAHFDEDAAQTRADAATQMPTLAALRDLLFEKQDGFSNAPDTAVNQVRRDVYDACREKAVACKPGVFALTVPTGGGKTRSSLAFALAHAAEWGKRRVIYAIPYTSIVDQTSEVFRDIFDNAPGVVLEHHSAIEPTGNGEEGEGAAGMWRRLAAQNWDAPVVVTTTVQLFESLFSNRPAKCRKLHNIAGSVIVLDEVQTLPTHLLQPLLRCLKLLTEHFGVTVVLCTATQPALKGKSPWLTGFTDVESILDDPKPYFEKLKRVDYIVEEEPWDAARVAVEMRAEQEEGRSCLCILNTRRDALAILDVLDADSSDPDVLHLSTLLCGKHRRAVLDTVKERLKNGPPVLLVATTVIECGVDVDFPTVLRAAGPLDRILQSAGRCNREGLRPVAESRVIIFPLTEGGAPQGAYRMALSETEELFRYARQTGEAIDFDDPDFVTGFFARLYATLGKEQLDVEKVYKAQEVYDYPTVAEKVKLIKDDTVSVLVLDCPGGEDEARALRDKAEFLGKMTRALWQRAASLSVSLYHWDADPEKAAVEEVVPGLLVWKGKYDAKRGIPLTKDPADAVVYKASNLFG